jgi:hypothetical protein
MRAGKHHGLDPLRRKKMRNSLAIGLCCGLATCAAAQEEMYALFSPTSPVLVHVDRTSGSWINSWNVTGHQALFGGLAYDPPSGLLYSIDGYNDPNPDRLFSIDPASGAGAVVGETGENWNFRMLHRDPRSGVMYGARDSVLYTMDLSTGEATRVAQISGPTLDQLTAFAINPARVANGTDIGGVGLFRIDLTTGAATHIGDLGGEWMNDLAFDSSGVLYGAERNIGVSTIDTATAQKTFLFNAIFVGLTFVGEAPGCYPDCDGNNTLDVFDFLCFQDAFVAMDPYADCDGNSTFDVFDFLCFQDAFVVGCP